MCPPQYVLISHSYIHSGLKTASVCAENPVLASHYQKSSGFHINERQENNCTPFLSSLLKCMSGMFSSLCLLIHHIFVASGVNCNNNQLHLNKVRSIVMETAQLSCDLNWELKSCDSSFLLFLGIYNPLSLLKYSPPVFTLIVVCIDMLQVWSIGSTAQTKNSHKFFMSMLELFIFHTALPFWRLSEDFPLCMCIIQKLDMKDKKGPICERN